MLLILTHREDLAADYLIVRLQGRKIPYVRFNTEDFPEKAQILLHNVSGSWDWRLVHRGITYDGSEFSAVYLRHLQLGQVSNIREADRLFVEDETAETLRSLWRIIPDERWLNHPRDVWHASNKILQLRIADELGFLVPRTVVSNDPNAITEIVQGLSNREFITKAVKHGFISVDGESVLAGTQSFILGDLTNPEVASHVPIVVQERIPKAYDIRVVVVRDDVFPVRIHSDVSVKSHPDWRVQQLRGMELEHEPIELPASVAELCKRIVSKFGLGYSSMDLIEDSQGRFWFLELNPNGQWVWIEQLTGCPIRDSLIRALGVGSYS